MHPWQQYEKYILDTLQKKFPSAKITPNTFRVGHFSKVKRQIDILVDDTMVGHGIFGVVECKYFNKKIDVKKVEEFIGFLEDVAANVGIMITNVGYTPAAKNRVKTRNIHLDVITYNELEHYEFMIDYCEFCPREIYWEDDFFVAANKTHINISTGHCSHCNTLYVRCNKCHHKQTVDEGEYGNIFDCYCGNQYVVEGDYVGNGLTEDVVYLVNKRRKIKFQIVPKVRVTSSDI